jgi:hypothetical protein
MIAEVQRTLAGSRSMIGSARLFNVRVDLDEFLLGASLLVVGLSRPGCGGENSSFLVRYRPPADPQRMKHLLDCHRVVGTGVGVSLVRCSPFLSWTRVSGAHQSVATGRHRPRSTLSRILIVGAPRWRRVRRR